MCIRDRIKMMLEIDPDKRISARDAYHHRWIQMNHKEDSFSSNFLSNLAAFSMKTKFKQAILTFIAQQVTSQQEKEELQQTFQSLDRDGNGIITREELIEGYIAVHKNRALAEVEVQKIMAQVDTNGSGQVDYTGALINNILMTNKCLDASRVYRRGDESGEAALAQENGASFQII
eukprot:TRINITY_DN12813_c0_g1_i1.p1 TRINITY_DN12813_c0_g1~~TRINITY_DN12813_c0_g1_i1.p1  ORF type:complete len:176 (+),score=34.97 TRINITY_DN12813_c0_g1_i1:64-591(+)